MSHGDGSYAVENARRKERERQAALDRSRAIADRILAVDARLSAHDQNSSDRDLIQSIQKRQPGPHDAIETIAQWNAKAQGLVDNMESTLRAARHSEFVSDVERHLAEIAASGEKLSLIGGEQQFVPRTGRKASVANHRADTVGAAQEAARAVATVDPDATEAELASIDRLARTVADADNGLAKTHITDLKVAVQAVGVAAERRRRDKARASELLALLDGIDGPPDDPEVRDLRILLGRVIAGETPLIDADAARVAGARARAIAAEDRAYVAEQLTKAFSDLGYDVYDSFIENLASGTSAYAFVGGRTDHAAEITLDAGRFGFRLVHASQSADTTKDVELELQLCDAVGSISGELDDCGIALHVQDYRKAGADPVPFVPQAAASLPRKTSAANRPKERNR